VLHTVQLRLDARQSIASKMAEYANGSIASGLCRIIFSTAWSLTPLWYAPTSGPPATPQPSEAFGELTQ
jgi:hypothetical protein